MNNIEELTRKLVEVTADRDQWKTIAEEAVAEVAGDVDLMLKCEAVIIAQRTRIAQLEAMLPHAYRAGVEATVATYVRGACGPNIETTWDYASNAEEAIRAQPIPTSAELLAKFKEAT
jgi:hypothetical protein